MDASHFAKEWASLISQLSWKIGGQQGEGVESTDRIFSTALNRLGYYLYGYRHFSSRIKGGHTNNKIRISTAPIRAISDDLDILVAFDQETIDLNAQELRPGGVIVADAKFAPVVPEGIDARLFAVPFTAIADELGASLMKIWLLPAHHGLCSDCRWTCSIRHWKRNSGAKGRQS